jgi:flagellar hook-associated protein 1 FlgK
MSSLISIMDTSLAALFSARVSMQTVGHNIANVNTPGFSRQEVLQAARKPVRFTYGAIGRGVEVLGIRRLTDQFLLANRRVQSSSLGSYTEVDSTLREVEAIFGSVENDHLGDTLTAFFGAWNELASPPADPSQKFSVLSAAENLVADFHAMDDSLNDLQQSLETALQGEVIHLNNLMEQVAHLNGELLSGTNVGTAANDLMDQRDLLLDEIATMGRIRVVEREDRTVDVIMGGRTMVTRDHVTRLETVWQPQAGGRRLSLVTMGNRIEVALDEGKLEGMVSSLENHVQKAREQLDGLARLVAERVNALHVQGRTDWGSGLIFFTGDSAATLDINPAIQDNPDLIATSRSGVEGDNDLALEIARLPQQPLDGEGSLTLMDSYRTILVDLASQRSRFEFLVESQQNVVAAATARLESVRGVSLDEEGARMLQYQHAYEAAARVITTVQEMYDTLINM